MLKTKSFEPFINTLDLKFLKKTFASAMLCSGAKLKEAPKNLSSEEINALKQKKELRFPFGAREIFSSDESISLNLQMKNISKLFIRIYKLNSLAIYKNTKKPPTKFLNLDGLKASVERVMQFDSPPIIRSLKSFNFPELKKPGRYFIEFIGGGLKSQAIILKGELHYSQKLDAAGHHLTIFNERGETVPGAEVWLGERRFLADESARLRIPYTQSKKFETLVLHHQGVASIQKFSHLEEEVDFECGFLFNREDFRFNRNATVLLRPKLTIHSRAVSLQLLKKPVLVITAVDLDGTKTIEERELPELNYEKDFPISFAIPQRLNQIHFTLKGEYKKIYADEEETLSCSSETIIVNGIDKSSRIQSYQVKLTDKGYVLDVLGKNGEAKENRRLHFKMHHRDFVDPITLQMQSDSFGQVHLGKLLDIKSFSLQESGKTPYYFNPSNVQNHRPKKMHIEEGEVIELPYLSRRDLPLEKRISVFKLNSGRFMENVLDRVEVKEGYLRITGLTRGNYQLTLKEEDQKISILVSQGKRSLNFIGNAKRQLELSPAKRLILKSVDLEKNQLSIQLKNFTPSTRVHVMGSTFYSRDLQKQFLPKNSWPRHLSSQSLTKSLSSYNSETEMDPELSYILERRSSLKFPGSMLKKPSLLLNPQKTIVTSISLSGGAPGGGGLPSGYYGRSKRGKKRRLGKYGGNKESTIPNFNYLVRQNSFLTNLKVNDRGELRVPLKSFLGQQSLSIQVVDQTQSLCQVVALPDVRLQTRDLSLKNNLNPKKHFLEKKETLAIEEGQTFSISKKNSSRYELIDEIKGAYELFKNLNSTSELKNFPFLHNWISLEEKDKCKFLSKYGCHELHFFIYTKDPDFFNRVLKNHLSQKKEKTFLEHWLLGHGLQKYLKPWAYHRLNTVEKILLSWRIEGESANTKKWLQDQLDLLPKSRDTHLNIFRSVLNQSSLKEEYGGEYDIDFGIDGTPPEIEEEEITEVTFEKKSDASEEMEESVEFRQNQSFFKLLGPTREWVETHYYKDYQGIGFEEPLNAHNSDIVVNSYWEDLSKHGKAKGFLSPHLFECFASFKESAFALSLIDLPFKAKQHPRQDFDDRIQITASSPLIIFKKSIQEVGEKIPSSGIHVSQNYFRLGDAKRWLNREKVDKFIEGELLTQRVYGSKVVISNSSSRKRKLDVLLQVPKGAIAVKNSPYTDGQALDLEPFASSFLTYYFYFPKEVQSSFFPVHVSEGGQLVAYAEAKHFRILKKASQLDLLSWNHVSQEGSEDEVMHYLNTHNLAEIPLQKIAFRVKNKSFFKKITSWLNQKHIYNNTLWSYSLLHRDANAMRVFLKHQDAYTQNCGLSLNSPLLTINPRETHLYEHMEFWPLIQTRAHFFGTDLDIKNEGLKRQVISFYQQLSYASSFSDEDYLDMSLYFLLRGRPESAMKFFNQVSVKNLQTSLQYDYFKVYMELLKENFSEARTLAQSYRNYPIDSWRDLFKTALSHLNEAEGLEATSSSDLREEELHQKAKEESFLDLKVEGKDISILYENLDSCTVNIYPMDIEVLFSLKPFAQDRSSKFIAMAPAFSKKVELIASADLLNWDLPEPYKNSNIILEVSADSTKKASVITFNHLRTQVRGNSGELMVKDLSSQKGLSKVYIKVMAKDKYGNSFFYKDGYTDLRGAFDYASTNDDGLEKVVRFSILIMSENLGSDIIEVAPPRI